MEFAARLPGRLKVRGTVLKSLLRKVAARRLPPANLGRRQMGFGVPVGAWMRGELYPLLQDALLSERAAGRGHFRPEGVRRLVREQVEGEQDHPFRLWSLLWLELWHREFFGRLPAAPAAAARPQTLCARPVRAPRIVKCRPWPSTLRRRGHRIKMPEYA